MDNLSRISTTRIQLKQDVRLLKSFMIGIAGRDKEGDYHPKFVQHMMKALRDKPNHTYRGAKTFLEKLDASV